MRAIKWIFVLAGLLISSSCNFPAKNIVYASRAIVPKMNGTIVLSWAPSAGNPQGYYVEESTNGVDFYQIQNVSLPTATITQVPPSATYYFRIRSYNEAGASGYSAVIQATLM